MKSWYEFYNQKCNVKYYNYVHDKYNPFISKIIEEMHPRAKIAEFGCGMGNITKALMYVNQHANYTLIDNSNEMLDLAEQNLDTLNLNIECWDILTPYPERFDLIHSHGVLEHFSDDEIKQIIENQLSICNKLIHYVPSSKYNYQSYGDERLLSKSYWRKNFKPTNIIEFNDGYDLILIWEK